MPLYISVLLIQNRNSSNVHKNINKNSNGLNKTKQKSGNNHLTLFDQVVGSPTLPLVLGSLCDFSMAELILYQLYGPCLKSFHFLSLETLFWEP